MDLQQIQHLNDEQKTAFAKLERLFNEPGWQLVLEIATLRADTATERILNAGNWEQALVNRGMRQVYLELIGLQETTEAEFTAMAAAQAASEQLEDESKFE